ncbi:MAG TPA: hypothetical protein VLS53_01075 [Candidatus Dormibacteraeota bacterium]|nr:hypothetical protein [Candidatus Dormibacteraeota bacterium]
MTKLRQGMEKLEPYRPFCMTIDVERLVRETAVLLADLQGRGRNDLPPISEAALPKVHRALPQA